jgi:hypothetical protein
MKKTIALILTIALLAACAAPAFASGVADVPDDGYEPAREWRLTQGRGSYTLHQNDDYAEYNAVFSGGKMKKLEALIDAGDIKIQFVFSGKGDLTGGEFTSDMEGDKYRYVYNGKDWIDSKTGKKVTDSDVLTMIAGLYYDSYKPEWKWYLNTVSLLGLPIRELKPGLTKKWYHIVPVDLSKDAYYTYPMVAGSIFYLGECQVRVQDGKVTVDYSLPEGLAYPKSHCLMWFTSMDEITPAFLENPKGAYKYGEPVSIADDLKGQEVALLFICNRASYRIPLTYSGKGFLTRYYSTQDEVRAMQADMMKLLEKVP